MPRKPTISTKLFPYHVTNRSNNKEHFYLSLDELWKIYISVLEYLDVELKIKIHAFVLMSNHYHLLVSTPSGNISEGMMYFHREVAKRSNRKASRINHFFGARYKWSIVSDENYFWNAVKYIFRNPVEAGIVERVEEYKFSSLNDKLNSKLWCLTDFFRQNGRSIELDLDWLNHSFESSQKDSIKRALRRKEFALPKLRNGQKATLDLPDKMRAEDIS